MINKAWNEFFGSGWDVHNVPEKRTCFEAGFNAAIKMLESKKIEKKTVPEIIKEWEDKYAVEQK